MNVNIYPAGSVCVCVRMQVWVATEKVYIVQCTPYTVIKEGSS